jgi:hypothetical protein
MSYEYGMRWGLQLEGWILGGCVQSGMQDIYLQGYLISRKFLFKNIAISAGTYKITRLKYE